MARRINRQGGVSGKVGVERWVVVHFHLAIDFQLLAAGPNIVQQFGERMREIGVLSLAAGESLADGGAMGFVGAIAGELFFQVIDPQRHDREAVGRAAGVSVFSRAPARGRMPSVGQPLDQRSSIFSIQSLRCWL